MGEFIYGLCNGIYIMDFIQIVFMLDVVLNVVCEIVVKGGCVFFVGIKCQVFGLIVDVVEKFV